MHYIVTSRRWHAIRHVIREIVPMKNVLKMFIEGSGDVTSIKSNMFLSLLVPVPSS